MTDGVQIGIFPDAEQARLSRGPVRDLSARAIGAFQTYRDRAWDHLLFDMGRPAGLVRTRCFREALESPLVIFLHIYFIRAFRYIEPNSSYWCRLMGLFLFEGT